MSKKGSFVLVNFIITYENGEQIMFRKKMYSTTNPESFIEFLEHNDYNNCRKIRLVSTEQVLKKYQRPIPWLLIYGGKFFFKNGKFDGDYQWKKYVASSPSSKKQQEKFFREREKQISKEIWKEHLRR